MVQPVLIYNNAAMWQRWNGLRYLPEVPSILIVEGAGLGKKIHHTGKGLHFLKTSEGGFLFVS